MNAAKARDTLGWARALPSELVEMMVAHGSDLTRARARRETEAGFFDPGRGAARAASD
jgi:hypothetical protein